MKIVLILSFLVEFSTADSSAYMHENKQCSRKFETEYPCSKEGEWSISINGVKQCMNMVLVTEVKIWEDAQADCLNRGARLVRIDTEQKAEHMKNLLTAWKFEGTYIWVGLKQTDGTTDPQTGWFWEEADPSIKTSVEDMGALPWGYGEPNNDAEHCGEYSLGKDGKLNNEECDYERAYVCETMEFQWSNLMPEKADWMSKVTSSTKLTEMSLPGTHDTMAFFGGFVPQTQSMSLWNQLMSGVRVLDIRCRHYENKFPIYHGPIYQHADFEEVRDTLVHFLRSHKKETVLVRLKEEHSPTGNTRTFPETLAWYLETLGQFFVFFDRLPTGFRLNTVRGKVVLMRDFNGKWDKGPFSSFEIQDNFALTKVWDLHGKWDKISKHLHKAITGDPNRFYINFLSGAVGAFPYFVASGHAGTGVAAARLLTGLNTPYSEASYPEFPRVACILGICQIAFEGMNKLTLRTVRRYRKTICQSNQMTLKHKRRVGIIMTDFAGCDLLDEIIAMNPGVVSEPRAQHQCNEPDMWREYGSGRCMQLSLVLRSRTWLDARDDCAHHGGRLAHVDSVQKADQLNKLLTKLEFGSRFGVWVGLEQRIQGGAKGTWQWVDGERNREASNLPWASGEPSYHSEEHCVEFSYWKNGRLNDENCDKLMSFVCEAPVCEHRGQHRGSSSEGD